MTDPERGPSGAHDRKGLLKKLRELLARIFSEKNHVQTEEERKKHHKKRLGHEEETKEERKKRLEEQEDIEKDRDYRKRRSAQEMAESVQAARQLRAQEVKDHLQKLLDDLERKETPHGAAYLIDLLEVNTDVADNVRKLIDESSVAAEIINNLITKGVELHGDPIKLAEQVQILSHEASECKKHAEVVKFLEIISGQVEPLLLEKLKIAQLIARKEKEDPPGSIADLLQREKDIYMTDEEKKILSSVVHEKDKDGKPTRRIDGRETERKWREGIRRMLTDPKEISQDKRKEAQWAQKVNTPRGAVPKKLVAEIDEIWGRVQKRELSGESLTARELSDIDKEIREVENRIRPSDIPAGTKAYDEVVRDVRAYTEEKLDALARQLRERLQKERPPLKREIVDPDVFLDHMITNKGRLGGLFAANPDMRRLFLGTDKKSAKFRNRVFLRIHSAVMTDQRSSSRDNFGLYERADFTTFTDVLRAGLSKYMVQETGETLGKKWSDWYTTLSNNVRQSRDIEFWASQPGAEWDSLQKALGMFQNEYTFQSMTMPAVNAAFRAYETVLRSIKNANDGYIPPALVEYDAASGGSFWDQRTEQMLRQMIDMGTVFDVVRDEDTGFHVVGEDGHTVEVDPQNPLRLEDMDPEEVSMYLTLAKGIGIVSARYLEIFATAKVPGSNQPGGGVEGFRSTAYEGVARAINYFNTVIHKWSMGYYKYFRVMNLALPEHKRIKNLRATDSQEASKMYEAYCDGTFEEIYGPEAKRFIDATNASNISSAIGVHTLWRQFDGTIDWSDKQRECLGSPTRLALSKKYAEEAVKNFLVVNKYREEYRQDVIEENKRLQPGLKHPEKGAGFDKLWREYGRARYENLIKTEWEKMTGLSPKKGFRHTPLQHETQNLIDAYTKAFKTRIWAEMTMRNPLVAAHSLKLDIPGVATDTKKKIKLHNLIVEKVLGIPYEDLKYGELGRRAGYATTPTKKQKGYLKEVLALEGDLAAVREFAIEAGRDLTEKDFIKAIGRAETLEKVDKDLKLRVSQALEYWKIVRQAILGSGDLAKAQEVCDRVGLRLLENGEDYAWDYGKIRKLKGTLSDLVKDAETTKFRTRDGRQIEVPFLLGKALDLKQDWILGTDDMAFRKMDWLDLGGRHWVRRGGDIGAHWEGGKKVTEYLTLLNPNPDKQELAKMLKEIRDAYSGDMIDWGWLVAGNLAYTTSKLYSMDLKRFGSAAQRDVWGTRRNVAAWMANGRREFWDALEHLDVLPPHDHFYHYRVPEMVDIHNLRKQNYADNVDVWKEIITLGILIALAMTLWRALTAPSEEETAGGGGGGHH